MYSPDLLEPKPNGQRHKCIDEARHTILNTGSRTASPTAESSLPANSLQEQY